MNGLLSAILLTILPISELRGGLPVGLIWATSNSVNPLLILIIVLMINFFAIFISFIFLDKIHIHLLSNKRYKKFFDKRIIKIQKKTVRFQSKFNSIGFLALILFVAIPLPISGGYTGALMSWTLNLDRKKSILSICSGVTIAGLIIYVTTLGILSVL